MVEISILQYAEWTYEGKLKFMFEEYFLTEIPAVIWGAYVGM